MTNWFNKSIEETAKELNTDLEKGLTQEQINERLAQYGLNELKQKKKKSLFVKFLEQFKDFMIIILIIAAIVSGAISIAQGESITDSIIILIVVIVNAIIGVAQEAKAEKSLEALQKLSEHEAKVLRNGSILVVPASDLVPGDIVILDTGDYVPADLRIIEAINLKSQEASLTGESVPVEKQASKIENEEVPIGDRINMLFSSSLITYGRGKAIVVETGMNTEVGKIADMLSAEEDRKTPLQIKLDSLGKTLGIVALIICAVIFIAGLIQGKEIVSMFMTAVSLAVAAIPEGLAAVSTIVLAIGVQKMAKRNAIVKNLPAVETLGSATVICSDKTGTLTKNQMTVQKMFVNDNVYDMVNMDDLLKYEKANQEVKLLVYNGMLCNDTKIAEDDTLTGDPTETALVDIALKLGFTKGIYETMPRVDEIPFDSERKLMTTVQKVNDKYLVLTKGGIDELLSICNSYIKDGEISTNLNEYKARINEVNEAMAKDALRVLGFAYKELDYKPNTEDLEKDLIFVGMYGMIDPPREEAKVAVEKCKTAGIKTVMITGDHKITATAIAKQLGILENENEAITGTELDQISDEDLKKNIRNYSVYARVAPEHKVRIVNAWQSQGEIVAMTGDGVNDSPALKQADIGCAMGIVGTDVAKEAADVILTDDNFATVVSAVEEGRRIYDNILKVIQFLLASNIGEIVVLFLATIGTSLFAKWFGITDISHLEILLPIHILWINLVTDSLPALALAFDPANKDIMERKPLKTKGIFTKSMTYRIIYQGIMIGLLTLVAFIIGLATTNTPIDGLTLDQSKIEVGQTMAFIVLAMSELTHVFNIRDNKKSIFNKSLFNNMKLIGAIIVSAGLMFAVLLIPALRQAFGIPVLPTSNILQIIGLVFAPIVIVEIFKLLKINSLSDEK